MTASYFRLLLIALILSLAGLPAKAGATIDANTDDGNVDSTMVNDTAYEHIYTLLAGMLYGNASSFSMVDAFPLPYLAPGQQVTGATISYYLVGLNGTPTYNLQLYGLNRVSTTSGAPILADWYYGSNDTKNTLLNAKMFNGSSPVNKATTYSGANLATFIQSQYTNSAFSGMDLSPNRYIFFRLSADGTTNGYNNFIFGSSRNPNRAYHPMLSLTISNGISAVAGRLQFSFNLPQAATTSAGVYDSSTGKLLRTIWNNVQYQAGTSYGVWDGKDDSGNALATGTNYKIKLIYHNVQYVWEGTVGNTSAAQSGPYMYHSYGKIHDMTISGTTGYYAVAYNENQTPFHQFTVGSPQVPSGVNFGYDLTDPNSCFYFCTSDATRIYWAKTFGGMNTADTYVIAFTKGGNNSMYTFPKGVTPTGGIQNYSSVTDYDATANQPNGANGIAVQQTGNVLFVSHGNLNVVRAFDKVQGTLLGSWTVQNPGRIATTANGDVWVISNGTSPSILRYSFANGSATLKQTITGLNAPVGIDVSADDALVLVADGGTSQQLKAFNNSTGAVAWTYGTLGGMDKNGANVTSNTFEFKAQRANYDDFSPEGFICFQPDNTFWLQDAGNSRIVHFSINGNTPTYIEQITFNDASYRATADVSDATRVFNNFLEYSVDYSLPLGGTNGSWKLVKNWQYGLLNDSTHYYNGFANGWINVATLSNGRTYGFLNNFISGQEDLFELPASGPARFTGYSFNHTPWIYPDGTLRFNIANGTNTALAYYSEPLTGFDANNNPVWGTAQLLASTALGAGDPIPWSAFPMRTEITASGIVLDFDADQVDTGFHLAGLPLGSTSWKWRSAPSTTTGYNGWFPQDGRFDIGNGVEYAGNHVMALGRNIVCGYHGEFWGGGEASQWLNFFDNGLMVGRFGTYAGATYAENGLDGYAGNSFSPVMVHGPNGKVYIYCNDEGNHGGTDRWRIDNWDGIVEISGNGAIGGTVALSGTQAPTVSITSPTANAGYFNGQAVTFAAEAGGGGAAITQVAFLDGTTNLGAVSLPPYTLNCTGLSAGTHTVSAQATDASGAVTTSAPITFTVGQDGISTPPPTPTVLTSTGATNQSASLSWTQPTTGTTSSTIGQILSFQFDSDGTNYQLASTDVAGAAPYAAAHFNFLGQQQTANEAFINVVNNAGTTLQNLEVNFMMTGSSSTNSTQSLTGTAMKLFSSPISTLFSTSVAVSLLNVPFANYDVVVYSLPSGAGSGSSATVIVNNGSNLISTIKQTFNQLPTTYVKSAVNIGTNASVTNVNTVVVQGLNSSKLEVQGGSLGGFQIVERPYDQGAATSYTIQRATGTSGTFATVGTATGTTFTDTSSVAAATTYQYRVAATNSNGTSTYSNVITVTTPGVTTGTTPVSSFSTWRSKYFTSAQLADATISGPSADPYGSGVPNLLAYALQLDPSTAKPTDVPNPTVVNGHLQVTYFVPTSITDVTYVVEVSANLTTWNSGTGYTQTLSNVTSSTGHTITVQDTLPTTQQKHFMRLRVTQN